MSLLSTFTSSGELDNYADSEIVAYLLVVDYVTCCVLSPLGSASGGVLPFGRRAVRRASLASPAS